MPRVLTRRPGDEGSIILSLLAIMVVSGLLLVVAGTVVAGQRQTRDDQGFEQALEVAEVGLAQMNSLVQNAPTTATFPTMDGSTTAGGRYTVSATKTTSNAGTVWSVQSVGTDPGGNVRRVQNDLKVRPLFNLAAFGKQSITFNGGNGADSFDSALGTDICLNGSMTQYANPGSPSSASTGLDTDVNMCRRTGLGAAATNGQLFLKGGVAARIDYAEVYNAMDHVTDPLPSATGTCVGVTETCALYSTGRLRYYRDPIDLPPINVCTLPGTPANATGGGTYGSRAYNLADVVLDGSTTFTGTVANPTILCISGRLTIPNATLVNFTTTSDGRRVPRRPGTLLIFMTGTSNSSLTLGNNASFSAAVYAPFAAVDCGPQGNVYGSLVANSINNAGGWNFHYDDALRDQMANAPVKVSNWAELH